MARSIFLELARLVSDYSEQLHFSHWTFSSVLYCLGCDCWLGCNFTRCHSGLRFGEYYYALSVEVNVRRDGCRIRVLNERNSCSSWNLEGKNTPPQPKKFKRNWFPPKPMKIKIVFNLTNILQNHTSKITNFKVGCSN